MSFNIGDAVLGYVPDGSGSSVRGAVVHLDRDFVGIGLADGGLLILHRSNISLEDDPQGSF